MRVAISGASGFIGNSLIKYCKSLKYEIKVLSSNPDFFLTDVEIFKLDRNNPKTLELDSFFENVDIFFNCLGEINNEKRMKQVNVELTKLFIDIARKKNLTKWVQLGSVGTYGILKSGNVNETCRESPFNLYEKTKTEADKLIMQSGIDYTILRPSIVFGKKMKNKSLYNLLNAILNNIFFYIGKNGSFLNYVHVDDVVSALVLCGNKLEANNKIYILSQMIEIEELVKCVLNFRNKKRNFIRVPKLPLQIIVIFLSLFSKLPLTLSRIDALSSFVHYDSSRIKKDLNFKFKKRLTHQLTNYMDEKFIISERVSAKSLMDNSKVFPTLIGVGSS